MAQVKANLSNMERAKIVVLPYALLILVFSLLTVTSIRAQSSANPTDRGTYTIKGDLSYSYTSYSGTENSFSELVVNPSVSYFLANNLSVILALEYKYISYEEFNYISWGIGPGLRFYLGSNFYHPFIGIQYIFNLDKEPGVKSSTLSFETGLDLFLTKNIAIEPILKYQFITHNDFKEIIGSNSKKFIIGIGLNAFIY